MANSVFMQFNGITTDGSGNSTTVGSMSAGGAFLGPNGSAAAPTFSFTANTNVGMYNGGGFPVFSVAGTPRFYVATAAAGFTSNVALGWSSGTTDPTATVDTGVSRSGVGVLAVGNGTAGDVTGTVNATIYKSGASTGVTTFGPAAVASITVKGGIVTAIS
jgi:hypothetical protein